MKALRIALVLALAFPFPAPSLWAWNANTHSLVADVAVREVSDLQNKVGESVPSEKLETLLAAWSQFDAKAAAAWTVPDLGKTQATFMKALVLNPAAQFGYLIGENFDKPEGSPVPVARLFETYVNEPDWGMDQYVCSNYPCDSSYDNMGARDPSPITTQAFRHMRWPGGYTDVENYIEKKVGLGKALPPIGQAPDRSQLFFNLAVKAVNTGHTYWALRFLAWSMHYAQDVTQPFHAAQIPSPNLVRYVKYTDRLVPDKAETTRVISYYHMAFENYTDTFAEGIQSAIGGGATMAGPTASEVVLQAADLGAKDSVAAGDASLAFFPPIPDAKTLPTSDVKFYLTGKNADGTPSKYGTTYLDALKAKEQNAPSGSDSEFKELASRCMGNAGGASKSLLTMFISQIKAPPAPGKASPPPPSLSLPNADAVKF